MRLRRRRRVREEEAAAAETPKPKPQVRTIIDPDETEPAQELATGEETPEIDDLTRRRLRREFLSMEKRQRLKSTGEEPGEAGQREARLIIKERGGEIAREPRRTIGPAAGDQASAEGSSGDPAVPRLERKASPLRRTHDVKLEVVPRGKPEPKKEDEDRWTDERKGVSWRWSVIIGVGMLGLVITALVGVQILSVVRREDGIRVQPVIDFEVERLELGDAKELLEADPEALYEEACEILQGYSGAADASEASTWVRGAEREALSRAWRPWESQPYLERPELIQRGVMSFQNPPALILWGLRKDFSPFRAYFVHEDGRLRLDWRATEAFSEIPLSELSDAGEVEGVTVRSVVQAKPFHTAALPDDKYRSFLLSGVNAEHFVWGYVERDSDLDRKLEDILSRNTGELETKSRGRATLVVGAPEWRDLDNQFLIAEVLHNEWVGP